MFCGVVVLEVRRASRGEPTGTAPPVTVSSVEAGASPAIRTLAGTSKAVVGTTGASIVVRCEVAVAVVTSERSTDQATASIASGTTVATPCFDMRFLPDTLRRHERSGISATSGRTTGHLVTPVSVVTSGACAAQFRLITTSRSTWGRMVT
ncbi:hypothetical protein BH24ACT12_BH24ACT12_07390 [soil metagenome]|jgi:hypothetical protein